MVIRVCKDKDNPYFVANNTAVNDHELSWAAKGLHTYFLSKPDDWEISVTNLVNSSTDGRDKVYSLLNELEDHGYLVRLRVRQPDGCFRWERHVYETPVPVEERTRKGKPIGDAESQPGRIPSTDSPLTDLPDTVPPNVANQEILLSIDVLSTEQQQSVIDNERDSETEAEAAVVVEESKSEENQTESSRLPEPASPASHDETTAIPDETDESSVPSEGSAAPAGDTSEEQPTQTRFQRFREWFQERTGLTLKLRDSVLAELDSRLGLRTVAKKIVETDLSAVQNVHGWLRSMPDWYDPELEASQRNEMRRHDETETAPQFTVASLMEYMQEQASMQEQAAAA